MKTNLSTSIAVMAFLIIATTAFCRIPQSGLILKAGDETTYLADDKMLNLEYLSELNNAVIKPSVQNPAKRNSITILSNGKPGGASPHQPDNQVLRYDNGNNHTALGSGGGVMYAAAYFPASTMGMHTGMELTHVEVYIYWAPVEAEIIIYGPGTSTTPGAPLHTQTINTTAHSWVMTELDVPLAITGNDLWIGYRVEHEPGYFSTGIDSGPAVVGFGDMVSEDGIEWFSMFNYLGFDNNLNIAGYLTESPAPIVFAGNDMTVCEDVSAILTEASAENYLSLVWTTNGDGTFDNVNELNPNYYFGTGDIANGSVNLCLTVFLQPGSGFDPETDCLEITIQPLPVVDIYPYTISVCEGDEVDFAGLIGAQNWSSVFWFVLEGDGVFVDETLLENLYSPSELDYLLGCIELGVAVEPFNPCTLPAYDFVTVCFQKPPTSFAGSDATICEDETFALTEATATDYVLLFWSSNYGSGTFNDEHIPNPVYTPGFTDFLLGSVELCLSASPINPCSVGVSDCMTLSFQQNPVADAGDDATLCCQSYSPNGGAENHSSIVWSTNGDGSFSDPATENPVYYPGVQDRLNESAELCLTAYPITPCQVAATDCMTLTITPYPVAIAGPDIGICGCEPYTIIHAEADNYISLQWTINGGTGYLDSENILHPMYYPSPEDCDQGIIQLCLTAFGPDPCMPVTDCMTLSYWQPPLAEAGGDETICVGDIMDFADRVSVSNYSSLLWTSSGMGSFSPSDNVPEPVYLPSPYDYDLGCIQLTLIAAPNYPCEEPAISEIELCFQQPPTVDAGEDATIAGNESHTLSGSAENYATVLWTTNGDGTFSNAELLACIYYPGTQDRVNESVELCLTATAISPCIVDVEDCMMLSIDTELSVYAGPDDTVCAETMKTGAKDCYQLNPEINIPYSEVHWTTSGDGVFDEEYMEAPCYFHGPGDLSDGFVILMINVTAKGAKLNTSDSMTLTFQLSPTANAGDDATVCESDTYWLEEASAQNYQNLFWMTEGTGTFSDEFTVNPIYYPSFTDYLTSQVILYFNVGPIGPCEVGETDEMVLYFQPAPHANAGPDGLICCGGSFIFEETSASNYTSLFWSTNGTGDFLNQTTLHPTYLSSELDCMMGSVEICLEALPISPCAISDFDCMTLTLQENPMADAGVDATITEGETYQLSGLAMYDAGFDWSTGGDGDFDPPGSLTPIYTPGPQDINAGSVELCLTAYPINPCVVNGYDCMMLTIEEEWFVDAGPDDTVCTEGGKQSQKQIDCYQLNGSTNLTSYCWTTDGDGYFDNDQNILNPVYCWGLFDIIRGSVTLSISQCKKTNTKELSDSMVLTLQPGAIANAGDDDTVCCCDSYTFSDATASNYASLLWFTTNGTGSFDNETIINPTYSISKLDCDNGSVEFCISASPIDPCTIMATDCITITIQNPPVVFAGYDQTICEDGFAQILDASITGDYTAFIWVGGDGTFLYPSTLETVYTPGVLDISMGMIYLHLIAAPVYPCQSLVSDKMIITIQHLPAVDAGGDATVCCGQDYTFTEATASNYSELYWTAINGVGTLVNESAINPTYQSHILDCQEESITFIMSAAPLYPCEIFAEDFITLGVVTLPEIECPEDVEVCLNDEPFEHFGIYFDPAEYGVGVHEFILTEQNECGSVECPFYIIVRPPPYLDISLSATEFCLFETLILNFTGPDYGAYPYTLYYSINGISETHTISGLTSAMEILITTPGLFTLEIISITDAFGCVSYPSEYFDYTVNPFPVVNAGPDQTIYCQSQITLEGMVANAAEYYWYTELGENGNFSNISALTTTYTVSDADKERGYVDLCLYALGFPPCNDTEDCMRLTIKCNSGCDDPSFFWAKQAGSQNYDMGNAIAVDDDGNVYTTGKIRGMAVFGSLILTSWSPWDDVFVAKQDKDGNFLWVTMLPNNRPIEWNNVGNAIAVSKTGNVYITGTLGIFISQTYTTKAFVAKFDNNGNNLGFKSDYWWPHHSGGMGIALNDNEDVHITGYDLYDPPALKDSSNFPKNDFPTNIFLTKLDNELSKLWHWFYYGTLEDTGRGITVDNNGDVFIIGDFNSSALTNPESGFTLYNQGLDTRDIVVAKHNGTTGMAEWTIQPAICKSGDDFGNDIAVDKAGYAYITGSKGLNIIAEKYSTSGVLQWSKQIENTTPQSWGKGISIAEWPQIGEQGDVRHIFITGSFEGTVDFDPCLSGLVPVTAFNTDMFILKLNTVYGEFADVLINESLVSGGIIPGLHSIAVDNNGCLHTIGAFIYADFDTDRPPDLSIPPPYPPDWPTKIADGGIHFDIFVQKLCCCCINNVAFLDLVALGLNVTDEGNCSVLFNATQFNDCHFFTTTTPDWGDGTSVTYELTPANPPYSWMHFYQHTGKYTIKATVVELDKDGVECWRADMEKEIVLCCPNLPMVTIEDHAFCEYVEVGEILLLPENYNDEYCDIDIVNWYYNYSTNPNTWVYYQSTTFQSPLIFPPYQFSKIQDHLFLKAVVQLDCHVCGLKTISSNVARIDFCKELSVSITGKNPSFDCSPPFTPSPFTALIEHKPEIGQCDYETIEWYWNGELMQTGGEVFQPPTLEYEGYSGGCFTEHIFTIKVYPNAEGCAVKTGTRKIKIYNPNMPVGELVIAPDEYVPFCYGEDATLRYYPTCVEEPAKFIWFKKSASTNWVYQQMLENGDKSTHYNTNLLYETTWYKVVQNGNCRPEPMELEIEVKQPVAITHFFGTPDPCMEDYVDLSLAFTPPISGNDCKYLIKFYRNGMFIHSIETEDNSLIYPYESGNGDVSGIYLATVQEVCCPKLSPVSTDKIIINPSCVPVISGPCYRCFDDPDPIELSVSMVIPPNKPCPCCYEFSYQWYRNGIEMTGETSSTFLSDEAGDFMVRSEVDYGYGLCTRYAFITVIQCPEPCPPGKYLAENTVTTKEIGVQNVTENEADIQEMSWTNAYFKVYPNPTDGTFTLEMNEIHENEGDSGIVIEMFDMIGSVVLSYELPMQKQYLLSLEKQQPGMYVIKVMIGNKLGTQKIIKR